MITSIMLSALLAGGQVRDAAPSATGICVDCRVDPRPTPSSPRPLRRVAATIGR